MRREYTVHINYDPFADIDAVRHSSWTSFVERHRALSIGHEREGLVGTSTLMFSSNKFLDSDQLRRELHPIEILDAISN